MVPLLHEVVDIAKHAGAAIMQVYADGIEVQHKADNSPLTQADLAAHQIIETGLEALSPKLPVLSEESASIPFETRKAMGQVLASRPVGWYARVYKTKWRVHRQHRVN